MQRVVRSTFVGLLALAGLTACGDKVTVPPATTVAAGTVVHQVVVSPASASLNVGDQITLGASVNADAGVTNRGVTWTSSNSAIATVTSAGVVKAVAAGNATIIAASAADPTVSGAAIITVGAGSAGAVPTVTISSINATNAAGQSVPANLAAAAGQLDVILNVEPNGATLKSVSATLKCGTDSMTRTQTISISAASASAAAAPVTFSFNTAEFNGTTGIPTLHNGACTISAQASTAAGIQSATNSTTLNLANVDGVIVRTTGTKSATDANGLPWKGGDITVTATPVLFSGRVPATVTINLPGATNAAQTVTATAGTPTSVTYSGSATSGARVTQLTLTGPVDANGFVTGVHPTVAVIDANGNDLALGQLNAAVESDARIDDQSPNAPTVFQIPTPVSATNATGQNGWVNAAYTFTGSAARYTSGGDAGVSAGAVSGTSGLNGNTTVTYFAAPAASFTALTGGTGTSATACANTGLTQITTAGDLAATLVNTAYRVRVNETDKLGNVRCTDLGAVGAPSAPGTTFGVDKVAPVDTFATGTPKDQAINPAAAWQIAISDDASGFTSTPAMTVLTRLDATGSGGTAKTTCVIGNGSSCSAISQASTLAVPATEGYYTYTATVNDQAQNAGATLARTALRDVTAPVMGGISVPASITGGSAATFSTSATDNLDLVSSNQTVIYQTNIDPSTAPALPAGSGLHLRSAGPTLGTAFDNVLTTTASFSLSIPTFFRNVQTTNAADAPVPYSAVLDLPDSVTARAVDAAGNSSASAVALIAAANVPQTGAVDYSTKGITSWAVSNAATALCNASSCAAPAKPTSVVLNAQAAGALSTFQVPFNAVQFYYFDGVSASNPAGSNEWVAIGNPAVASTVTDNAGAATRTFTWSTTFDPPANLGTTGAAVPVIAIGYNTTGDALATRANNNITVVP